MAPQVRSVRSLVGWPRQTLNKQGQRDLHVKLVATLHSSSRVQLVKIPEVAEMTTDIKERIIGH